MTTRRVAIAEVPRATMRELLDDARGVITRPSSDEHIAITLAAAGERDLLDEITRPLTPWARDRVMRT